jgi:hypothetical protein
LSAYTVGSSLEGCNLNAIIADRSSLLQLNAIAGEDYGTEDFSLFLFSLVKMHIPETVVELGTGLGVSALWMALAARENGIGHVWTVDDFEWFNRRPERATAIIRGLCDLGIDNIEQAGASSIYSALAAHLQLDSTLTFVKAKIALSERNHFDLYSFHPRPIDLLFSDFNHGGSAVLLLLAHFIPRLAPAASIIIHSASTAWTSYLLLEQLISQLNSGKVPKALQDVAVVNLQPFIENRRITLMHLVEKKARNQNSAAWLRFEPADVFPYPRTKMRK